MTREIKRYPLDFDKTINYFLAHISCKKKLSEIIVRTANFKNGAFFTFLPSNAALERIYDFEHGILPSTFYGTKQYEIGNTGQVFHPTQVVTMDRECSRFISAFLKKNPHHCCLVENYMSTPDSAFALIENVRMIPYKNEVYYSLINSNSIDDIKLTIRQSSQVWHSLFVLSTVSNEFPSELTDEFLQRFCSKIQYVITGAYDEESYIIWATSN